MAAAILLADVTFIWIGVQADFAFDFTCCYQQAAERVLTDPSTLYQWSDAYTLRYTPLGALPSSRWCRWARTSRRGRG